MIDIGISDRDIARHIGDPRDDTTGHLSDDDIAAALTGAPTLLACAKWLTGRGGRFVMRSHLARRIEASPRLRRAARGVADQQARP